MHTLEDLISRHHVNVLEYLDRGVSIPVISDAPQAQGDVIVIPRTELEAAATPVPQLGFPVVRGEAGGNTHTLLADGPVFFNAHFATGTDLSLGTLTVPEDSTAWLAHPEHGYAGIGAGTYEIRRQREQAEVERVVSD